MRYSEILAECAAQRAGRKQQIGLRTAKGITEYFGDDSGPVRTFAETGEITEPYEQLWERFFPKERRPDAEWTVALAFRSYLYSRRNHREAPLTWRKA